MSLCWFFDFIPVIGHGYECRTGISSCIYAGGYLNINRTCVSFGTSLFCSCAYSAFWTRWLIRPYCLFELF